MALCVMGRRKGEIMKEGLSNKLTITLANRGRQRQTLNVNAQVMVMIEGVPSSCVL